MAGSGHEGLLSAKSGNMELAANGPERTVEAPRKRWLAIESLSSERKPGAISYKFLVQ